jgi:hypothetical protein
MMVLFFYIAIFSIQIIVCGSISKHFGSDLSVFDIPDFADRIAFPTFPFPVTDRIKTYTSENCERVFPTISNRFHP